MARYLSAADIAVSLIKNCYSKQSSSPTKNAEYLASGLPIIANRGVGDVDLLIEKYGVGALIADFDAASFLRAFEKIESLGDVRSRCREAAEKEFDLESIGGKRYRRLYSKITNAGQY
jgi:glycosyltransferase involved in cell wall biosynthesis